MSYVYCSRLAFRVTLPRVSRLASRVKPRIGNAIEHYQERIAFAFSFQFLAPRSGQWLMPLLLAFSF